jgi:regulator of PEP synthase PpsR (kinase-PPPase family)
MGTKKRRPRGRSILILSDTTGVTAKSAVEKGLSQFNGCDERFLSADDEDEDPCELMQKTVYPFIRNKDELPPIIEKATTRKSLVVSTFADPEMRMTVAELCQESKLSHVDLLGPMFDAMTTFFNREPMGMAGPATLAGSGTRRRELTELYYSQVDSIEFTLKADDGMALWLLKEADVILIGVSRTGKTPLSVYLAQSLGLKVSNIPLALEIPPPQELFEANIDPNRVFCLSLNPLDLQRIRECQLEKELEKMPDKAETYADWDYLQKDLANARQLAEEHNFTQIDVTGRAVEETASMISSMLNERFSTGL